VGYLRNVITGACRPPHGRGGKKETSRERNFQDLLKKEYSGRDILKLMGDREAEKKKPEPGEGDRRRGRQQITEK